MKTSDTRKPYTGSTRSLVVALDIGTTFSGVSYAILEPGEIPKIHGVTRFPGQEHIAGNSKIPTILYYDAEGGMMAAGAEADTSSVLSLAEDEGWTKVELFKLRLRPRTMKLNMNGMRMAPLPRGKTAVHVFGDFLSYLFLCTRSFITDTHANGASLWKTVEHDIQFVLSHPNGWEGAQQTKMRRAAVYGGLIPDTNEGKARIRFVTEGEASLHACVLNGLAADVLSNPSRTGFLIADAGGGTLDISSYNIFGQHPLVIEEIAPPDCIFAGSVFVSRRARVLFQEKLMNSRYGTPDSVDHITKRFDETTKRLFRDKKDPQFIPFGSPLDKDLSVGIRSGQLKLSGEEVAELFEPSIRAAVSAIKAQIDASQGMIKSVFLVGGYAASAWLFTQLQERLGKYGVIVSRPDSQTSKAVADGAIGFYCDHHVSTRMSKFMYGVEYLREYNSSDPDHVERKERLCELPSGPRLLPDAFDCILARGVKVKESTVFTRKYCTELTSLSLLSVFEVEIWCYRGGNTIPKWIMRQAENFSTLCLVRADLSPLAGSAEPKKGKHGRTYWNIVFSVEIHFGLTEFKARIKWVDNGVTKYGPASIIYNERGHRTEEDESDEGIPEDDITTPAGTRSGRDMSLPGSRAHSRDVTRSSYRPPGMSTSSSKRTSTMTGHASSNDPVGISASDLSRSGSEAVRSRTSTAVPEHVDDHLRGRASSGRSRDKRSSGIADSAYTSTPSSRSTRSSSKLGEELSAVWGAPASSTRSKDATPLSSPRISSPITQGFAIPDFSTPSQPPAPPDPVPSTKSRDIPYPSLDRAISSRSSRARSPPAPVPVVEQEPAAVEPTSPRIPGSLSAGSRSSAIDISRRSKAPSEVISPISFDDLGAMSSETKPPIIESSSPPAAGEGLLGSFGGLGAGLGAGLGSFGSALSGAQGFVSNFMGSSSAQGASKAASASPPGSGLTTPGGSGGRSGLTTPTSPDPPPPAPKSSKSNKSSKLPTPKASSTPKAATSGATSPRPTSTTLSYASTPAVEQSRSPALSAKPSSPNITAEKTKTPVQSPKASSTPNPPSSPKPPPQTTETELIADSTPPVADVTPTPVDAVNTLLNSEHTEKEKTSAAASPKPTATPRPATRQNSRNGSRNASRRVSFAEPSPEESAPAPQPSEPTQQLESISESAPAPAAPPAEAGPASEKPEVAVPTESVPPVEEIKVDEHPEPVPVDSAPVEPSQAVETPVTIETLAEAAQGKKDEEQTPLLDFGEGSTFADLTAAAAETTPEAETTQPIAASEAPAAPAESTQSQPAEETTQASESAPVETTSEEKKDEISENPATEPAQAEAAAETESNGATEGDAAATGENKDENKDENKEDNDDGDKTEGATTEAEKTDNDKAEKAGGKANKNQKKSKKKGRK
ncbi:hypothetical protein D9758_003622 [Tetrapyrgos nigripes]|uniref:Uncharacterized protein n=1 Tax=Tetrapyrgos nigripes TaxID=182062 RepID=A0A8H5LS90_9AGAR|nr:hypothetical protein D9758_003622 [Tetrapyrgos nigripes]